MDQKIGKTGYFFAWEISRAPDSIPLAIHPKIQGQDVASVSFVQTGAALKEGYMEYKWKNPGEKAARKKSMYLSYFEPWQWVIATSSYREEFYDLINLEDLRKNILSVRFGKTGYPYILDSRGNIVIHPMLEGMNFYNDEDETRRSVVQKICSLKNGKLIYFWKNPGEKLAREKLVIFNYLPEFDWIVASSSYLEEFYQPLNKIRKILTGLALFCMLLLFTISFLLSSYFTQPIKRLMTNFKKGANGDFSVRTSIHSYDEIGKLGHYFNSFMETFERYTRKLEESEAKYKGIYKNSSEGIFQIDEQGDFMNLNPSMRLILGYPDSQDENPGLPVPNFQTHFPQKKWQEFQDELTTSDQKVNGFETEFLLNNGNQIWVSINARWVQAQHESTPWLEGTLIDISEKRKTQAFILQAEKMVSVGGLAAGMAHEINNPLAGMMQNAQVAINRTSIDLPANQKAADELGVTMEIIDAYFQKRGVTKSLESIREAGERAAHIVANMLSFSKKGSSHLSICNLSELLERTIELTGSDYNLKKHYDFKSIKLYRDYAKDTPPVYCEPSMIQQVLMNILKNGAEVLADKRTRSMKNTAGLTEWKPAFKLKIFKADTMVCISIEDNGPGMDESTLKRIFEPFFTTKAVGAGTGLGLSISYFIITENHGGSIEANSTEGKGTCFIIKLPIPDLDPDT